MISQIEDAVVKRVDEKLSAAAGKVSVQRGVEGISQPAVYVSTEEGRFEKTAITAFRQYLTIYVDIVFGHLGTGGEAERRKGIYLILEGVIQTLLLQTLGLKISPLVPKGFKNTTTDEIRKKGLIVYSVEMETSYYIAKADDEAAVVDLLRIGLDYYLKPGDNVPDATDLKTL